MADSVHPVVDAYAKYVNPAFVRLLGVFGFGRVFTKARGTLLWDDQGREYLDFLAAFGALNLGHNPPRLRERLKAFLDEETPNVLHVGPSAYAARLAEQLAALTGGALDVTTFSTTGAEAVEAAMKIGRLATGRRHILHCTNGYHGLTLGTLSIAGEARMKKPLQPLLADCEEIPFGELSALEAALSAKRCAAFIVEPVQGEGGVHVAPRGYLRSAQDLCRRHGALFVVDEVQTGLGRTGKMLACDHDELVPDVLVLGKSLGGGIAAIAATLTRKELHAKAFGSMDRFDLHGSTFAANAFACAAALETLRAVTEDALSEKAAERGAQLLDGLRERLSGHPFVRDIRGQGLLVGVELGAEVQGGLLGRLTGALTGLVSKRVFGQWLALRLLEEGILCQPASQQWNVLRLEPPLTVSAAEVDRVIAAIAKILGQYRDLGTLFKDVGERMGKQFLAGGPFG